MNTILITLQAYCAFFARPDMYLTEGRQKLACTSAKQIVDEALRQNLAPAMVMAVIYVESGWKRKAISSAGACGLTQVIPKYTGSVTTKKKYTCGELLIPKTSISVGIKTLYYWIHKYAKGNIRKGLCGYNSGYRCKNLRYAKKVVALQKKIEKFISIQK
jgi:soluble lytic murein transglycosylase-like protein